MGKNISLIDLLDPRKVNHCIRSRQKRYLAGKRDFYPWSVEIHPTAKCNYSCTYCAYQVRNANNQSVPEDALKSLYDVLLINKVKGIFFAGGGEPLLYPGIHEHIVYLNRAKVEVALLTNGSLLVDEKYDEMLSSLNYVAISIPSLIEEEFKTMAGRRMPLHLLDLPSFIRRDRRKAPIVGSRLVAFRENYKSVIETIKKIKTAAYDYCIVKIPKDPEGRGLGLDGGEVKYLRDLFSETKGDIGEDFTNIGSVLRVEQSEKPIGDVCWSIEYGINCFIHTDGGVYLCLPLLGKKEFCIGNLRDENFDDIWRGERKREVVLLMQERYKKMECRGCRNIAYNNIIEKYPESGFSKDLDPFL